jgi:peptidoglycan/LPS O-acetylase OafA/YrhL
MQQPKFFEALTGVRAIAAYMVFLHHFNPFKNIPGYHKFWLFVNELHIGVTLFFVLSGFLIAHKYLYANSVKFKQYFFRRFARIYPLFFILTTVTFLWVYFQNERLNFNWNLYLLNITFLKGLFSDIKFTGIAQGWSLTVEEMFYLSAPLWFLIIRKSKWAILLLPVFIFLVGCLLVKVSQSIGLGSFMSSYGFMAIYTFMGRSFEFFLGIGLAYMFHNNLICSWKINFTYTGVIVIALCVFFMSLCKGPHVAGIHHPVGIIINNMLLPLFGILPLYYGLIVESTVLKKFLSLPVMQLLGKSSYAFYLLHMGVFMVTFHNMSNSVLVCFMAINLLSITCYLIIEEPLNVYLRKTLASS